MADKKYLIVECEELNDPYECDADRKPLGMTDDISIWKRICGYEIYKIKSDGKVELIKNYEKGDLYITTSSRKTYYIIDEDRSYVCDLTDEMKILLR